MTSKTPSPRSSPSSVTGRRASPTVPSRQASGMERESMLDRMAPTREGLIAELRRHVADERVLEAIAAVPRDVFVPEDRQRSAWANEALPIGAGQTISQPLVVAHMSELLAIRD